MPLYEFDCRACGERFEELVRAGARPVCPECGSAELDKLLSATSVRSSATASLSRRAAHKRDAGQAKDRMHERLKYEKSHDRHG